jgi:mono/diheme cytochrome c family protein
MNNASLKKPIAAKYIFFYFTLLSFCIIQINANGQTNKWVVPEQASAVTNPLSGNTAVIKDAQVLYKTYCTPCHGNKGKGDGPAAASLNPKPADHTSALVQSETDGSLFWRISEGHPPMPPYKATFSEAQRWELVNYIRTLAKPSNK